MARKGTSITQLPSGRWQARYRDDDGRQRSRAFATMSDAQAFLDATRTAVRSGLYVDPDAGRERFGEYALVYAAAQDWKHSTRSSFDAHIKRLGPLLGRQLGDIDQLVLGQVRQALAAHYAHSTATISLHYACAIMRSAFQTGRIPRDPTVNIKPPKRRDGRTQAITADEVPTRAEVAALIEGAAPEYRAAIALGAWGLRISEIIGTTVGQFRSDDDGTVWLHVDRQLERPDGGTFQFGLPKRDKVREIYVVDWVAEEVERHLRDHGPFWPMPTAGGRAGADSDALLFRGGRGAPMRRDSFYDSVWNPAKRAAGIGDAPYTPHSLRHWCASALLLDGEPIEVVAGHLGDTPEEIHKTYSHWLKDHRRDARYGHNLLRPRLTVVEGSAAV